jgi:hypothetical protein
MTPNALLSWFDLCDGPVAATGPRLARETAKRLHAPHVRSKIAELSRLPDTACNTLWPSSTGWELIDGAFRSYCPHCCLSDLREQRTPYGRRGWQQSWCTLCLYHGHGAGAPQSSSSPSGHAVVRANASRGGALFSARSVPCTQGRPRIKPALCHSRKPRRNRTCDPQCPRRALAQSAVVGGLSARRSSCVSSPI